MSDNDRLILVGRVQGAFGVRGELRIRAYTADPAALIAFKTLRTAEGAPALTLSAGRVAKDGVIVRVKGVDDKDAADALRGLDLYAPRSALPAAEEDEFYLADLIGLSAVSPDGAALGTIKSVQDFGAGDLLEIAPEDGGQTWMIAFTLANVPEVDIAGGRVVIERPPETD